MVGQRFDLLVTLISLHDDQQPEKPGSSRAFIFSRQLYLLIFLINTACVKKASKLSGNKIKAPNL